MVLNIKMVIRNLIYKNNAIIGKRIKCLLLIFVFLTPVALNAQKFNKEKLDSLLNLLSESNKGMGSMAILKEGKLIYSKAVGCRDCEAKLMADAMTKYRIGSITKMFTATMIFQLIEDGKLNLDTKLDQFFPQIINAGRISISNMLNHRSGIYDFTHDSLYAQWNASAKSHEEILSYIAGGPSVFEPNSKAEYSNSNYVLLGYIIEKLYKKPYKEVLKEKISNKLGLKNTYYGDIPDIKNNEAYSYTYQEGWKQEASTDLSIPNGAGAIVSNPTDLIQFAEALFNTRLLSIFSLNQMKTMTDSYGMGLFSFPFGESTIYGHTGGIDGFASVLGYFPDDKIAIAYCTNGQVYPMNDILLAALNICFDKPYTLPVFKSIHLKTEDLDKYLGVYSNPNMEIKMTISKNNTTLIAQGTDQPAFPLEAIDKDKFSFDQAGVVLIFNTEKGEVTILQGGGQLIFTKE